MKKILGIAMVLGVFGVILGGCGSSEPAATETAGATAGAATAGATAGEAAK
jgi:hypothetical protein